jgi:hypothetical protein
MYFMGNVNQTDGETALVQILGNVNKPQWNDVGQIVKVIFSGGGNSSAFAVIAIVGRNKNGIVHKRLRSGLSDGQKIFHRKSARDRIKSS